MCDKRAKKSERGQHFHTTEFIYNNIHKPLSGTLSLRADELQKPETSVYTNTHQQIQYRYLKCYNGTNSLS